MSDCKETPSLAEIATFAVFSDYMEIARPATGACGEVDGSGRNDLSARLLELVDVQRLVEILEVVFLKEIASFRRQGTGGEEKPLGDIGEALDAFVVEAEAVHEGHVYVTDNEFAVLLLDDGKGFDAVAGDVDMTVALEDEAEEIDDYLVIIGDEDVFLAW